MSGSERQRVTGAALTREPRGFSPPPRYRGAESGCAGLSRGVLSREGLGNGGRGEEEKRNTKEEKHNR